MNDVGDIADAKDKLMTALFRTQREGMSAEELSSAVDELNRRWALLVGRLTARCEERDRQIARLLDELADERAKRTDDLR